jgi:hypothetical protein
MVASIFIMEIDFSKIKIFQKQKQWIIVYINNIMYTYKAYSLSM